MASCGMRLGRPLSAFIALCRRAIGVLVSTGMPSLPDRRAFEPHGRLARAIPRLVVATMLSGVLVPTSVSRSAEYVAQILPQIEGNRLELRTIQRTPGHWYVRFRDLDWRVGCPDGRTDFVILERGDYRPAEVPIRRGRFRAVLRQVDFEIDPFLSSGTFVLSGRFGPNRASGRRLSGNISASRVGEGGKVCRARAAFFGSRF